MNRTIKAVVFWLVIGVSALLLWQVVKGAKEGRVHEGRHLRTAGIWGPPPGRRPERSGRPNVRTSVT